MADPFPLGALRIETSALLPPGKMALLHGRDVIWFGSIGAPVEDVLADPALCDGLMVHPSEFDRLREAANGR